MPSPTSSTRPTSRMSRRERNCSISVCRTETISSALNLITASRKNLFLHVIQVVAHGAIYLQITDADLHAAQQLGADAGVQNRLLLKGDANALDQGADGCRRARARPTAPARAAGSCVRRRSHERHGESRGSGRADRGSLRICRNDRKTSLLRSAKALFKCLAAGMPAQGRTGEQRFQLRLRLEDVVQQRIEFFQDDVGLPLGIGGSQQRFGVDAGDAQCADVGGEGQIRLDVSLMMQPLCSSAKLRCPSPRL